MKILILTFYYPPDLSAGSYRAAALVDALGATAGPDLDVHVLTTTPNRYTSYREALSAEANAGTAVATDCSGRVVIERLALAAHNNGLLDQCVSFGSFAVKALLAVRGNHYDLVVATSSRLFTGVLGALIARLTGALLYLDVRDLFVAATTDLFRGKRAMGLLTPILSRLERFAFSRATRINLVSRGFLDYCTDRFPDRTFSTFGNGIDSEFLGMDYSKPRASGAKRILYAGNIGLGQALESIIPAAAQRLGDSYEFRIIGDGGQREALMQQLASCAIGNVTVLPPIGREALKAEYQQADYLFLHLNSASAMDMVVPSKIFEYAATGKPILAGVRGHAREFIEREVEGAVAFDPGDVEGMVEGLARLGCESVDRGAFVLRHSRRRVMREMACDVLNALHSTPRIGRG